MVNKYIDRPPRIQPSYPVEQIEIPPPPKNEKRRNQPIWALLLPLVGIGAYVLIGITGQGRNLLLLIPMALAVIASTVLVIYTTWRENQEYERQRQAYIQRLIEMRQEMVNAHDMQRTFYRYNYPDIATTLAINGEREESRFGSRLWERRPGDDDFGHIRLGIGTLPSHVIYKVASTDNDEDPLLRDAQKLAQDSRYIDDVPIVLPLRRKNGNSPYQDDEDHPVRPTVGISGENQLVYEHARALVTHFTAFHSPDEAHLFVVGVHEAQTRWAWARHMPHCPPVKGFDEAYFPFCFEDAEGKNPDKKQDKLSLFWKALRAELDRRASRLRDREEQEAIDVTIPFMLVVVDLLEAPVLPPGDEWLYNSALENLEAEAAVTMTMQSGLELGVAMLFLVPQPRKVPSGCQAIIEIEQVGEKQVDFRYAETGVNTPRFIGTADCVMAHPINDPLLTFAQALAQWDVRRGYGADIPDSLTLRQMHGVEVIEDLNVPEKWQSSRQSKNADWIQVEIGMLSGGEMRELHFSADRDGVHGMIAGTTGSGKSELLTTLILGLAMRYDPRIVNFVLVDFKGGQAFDPFYKLPHAVDIVTNLGQSAVDRMFTAINAELNRRQALLARRNVKHIVKYREKGYHEREPFPHLFIIIDEFAEMIAGNSEYRAQLDSITRLGRSLGVTLILAAQRPSGVTDQMRSNIKIRICLRVETREESNELLRRPDAALLPSIPGRGYLQIGNESIDQIQIAWTGDDYPVLDWQRNVIWINKLRDADEPPPFFEAFVDAMEKYAQMNNIPPQRRPWPSPLPEYLPLTDDSQIEPEYLDDQQQTFIRHDLHNSDEPLVLSPAVKYWMEDNSEFAEGNHWQGINWEERAMRAVIGLVDDPANARRRNLLVDLQRGHTVMYGASGWGKTTFLRTFITTLAASHSPDELHVYILDFGSRQLGIFRPIDDDGVPGLPHLGAYILTEERERVQRLLRKLDQILEERKSLPRPFYTYNAAHAGQPEMLPAILIVIDNFAEFKSSYEDLLEVLKALVREGRSNGIHFVITADQMSAVPNSIYSLFTNRLTLRLANSDDYPIIVGRGVREIDEIPGRGYTNVARNPLAFQVATPVDTRDQDGKKRLDEMTLMRQLMGKMSRRWEHELAQRDRHTYHPEPIPILPQEVSLRDLLLSQPAARAGQWPIRVIYGLDDNDLGIAEFPLRLHTIISGDLLTGKTSTLWTIAFSLAYHYSPKDVAFIFVDRSQQLFTYSGGVHSLADLPHTLMCVAEQDELEALLENLIHEYQSHPRREIVVFIDNYEDFGDIVGNKRTLRASLGNLARTKGGAGLHLIVAVSPQTNKDELIKPVAGSHFSIGLDTNAVEASPINGRLTRAMQEIALPPGRAFLVRGRELGLVQLGKVYADYGKPSESLDWWVETIKEAYPGQQAEWTPRDEKQHPHAGSDGRDDDAIKAIPVLSDDLRDKLDVLIDQRKKDWGKNLQSILGELINSIVSPELRRAIGDEFKCDGLTPELLYELAYVLHERDEIAIAGSPEASRQASLILGRDVIALFDFSRQQKDNEPS